MPLKPSDRASKVQPFIVMDFFREANALAAAGHDVVHMSAGQPAGGPPRKVVEAARDALNGAYMGYTDSLGLMALRERIAAHYDAAYGVSVEPGQHRHHHRLVGLVRAGLHGLFRRRRPGGPDHARLPGLPEHL